MKRFARICGVALAFGVQLLASVSWAATATRVTAFDYEPGTGRLSKVIAQPNVVDQCAVESTSYDAYGNVKVGSARNCNGSAGQFPGSGAGNVEAAAPGSGSPAPFASRSTTSDYVYNGDGSYQVTRTNILNEREVLLYQGGTGLLLRRTDPSGAVTSWTYDGLGRVIRQIDPGNQGTSWSYWYCSGFNGGTATCQSVYGVAPAYVVTSTPIGKPRVLPGGTQYQTIGGYTSTYYDAYGRVLRVATQGFDGTLIYADAAYDQRGRVVTRTRPYFQGGSKQEYTFGYDAADRLISSRAPNQRLRTIDYNGKTVTTTIESKSWSSTQNDNGEVVESRDPTGAKVVLTYDAGGNLRTAVDHYGNTRTTIFNEIGKVTSLADPDSGTRQYQYNAAGELVYQQDGKGQAVTLAYDQAGRIVSRLEPTQNSIRSYGKYINGSACSGGAGKLCEVSVGNGYKGTIAYDSVGRPVSFTSTLGTKTFVESRTYESGTSRIASISYPSGMLTLSQRYNSYGYLDQISNASDATKIYWRALGADAELNVVSASLGNGIAVTSAFYPETGYLKSRKAGASDSVQSLLVSYDKLGNVEQYTDQRTGVQSTFKYDDLNQLKEELRSGGGVPTPATIAWGYDAIGNVL